MLAFGKQKGEKYHTRTIETDTYDYDEKRFVVEGCLTDHRFKDFKMATGEERSPGILHQMVIYLLVNKTSLEIEDLQVEMPVIPRGDCLETINSMNPVKGLKVVGGFTAKVKDVGGGTKGCNHLVALLTAMGPSVMQGYGAYHDHHIPDFLAENFQILMNTCWTWREDGPLVGILEDRRKAGGKR